MGWEDTIEQEQAAAPAQERPPAASWEASIEGEGPPVEAVPDEQEQMRQRRITKGLPAEPGKPVMGTPFDNPLFEMSSAPARAVAGVVAKGVQAVTNPVKDFITRLSPMQHGPAGGGGLANKALDVSAQVGEKVNRVLSNSMTGRMARHVVPGAQKLADTAEMIPKVTRGAAGLTAAALEDLGPKLGKFEPILKSAAERGGSALGTADFILQQTEPEYQKIRRESFQ
jgi:hypothetical protein